MPEVKITLADLSYMTGLLPGGIRCSDVKRSVIDRLIFMGLIVKTKIHPDQNELSKFENNQAEGRAKLKAAVDADDWNKVDIIMDHGWYQYHGNRRPQSREDYVLTKAGLELMEKGSAKSVTSAKSGCIN